MTQSGAPYNFRETGPRLSTTSEPTHRIDGKWFRGIEFPVRTRVPLVIKLLSVLMSTNQRGPQ